MDHQLKLQLCGKRYQSQSLQRTGGGKCDIKPINKADEKIISAAELEKSVDGLKSVKSFGNIMGEPSPVHVEEYETEKYPQELSPSASNTSSLPYDSDADNSNPSVHFESYYYDLDTSEGPSKQATVKASKFTTTEQMLKQQLEQQKEFQDKFLALMENANEMKREELDFLKYELTERLRFKKLKLEVLNKTYAAKIMKLQ